MGSLPTYTFLDRVFDVRRMAKSVLWHGLILLCFPVMGWCVESNVSDFQDFKGDWGQIFHGNLIFQLSNQSPNVDPVDMSVYLDGKLVLEKELPFLSARYIETLALNVQPGQHRVAIKSKKGKAEIVRTVTVKDRLFVAVLYWYYTDKDFYGPVKRHLQIKTSATPMPQE